jgi:hypothetical protein
MTQVKNYKFYSFLSQTFYGFGWLALVN